MATGEIMIPVKSIAVLLAKRAVVRAPLRSVFRVSRTKTVTPRLFLPGFVLLGTLASSSQVTSPTDEIKSPDLNLILQRLEDTQHQEPAQARPYEVTREYKVLRGYNTQPPLRSWPRSISFLLTLRRTKLFRRKVSHAEKEWFASFWLRTRETSRSDLARLSASSSWAALSPAFGASSSKCLISACSLLTATSTSARFERASSKCCDARETATS
jgi:hypothetical protein